MFIKDLVFTNDLIGFTIYELWCLTTEKLCKRKKENYAIKFVEIKLNIQAEKKNKNYPTSIPILIIVKFS